MLLAELSVTLNEWAIGGIVIFVVWLIKMSFDVGSVKKAVLLTLSSHEIRLDDVESNVAVNQKGIKKNREDVIKLKERIHPA